MSKNKNETALARRLVAGVACLLVALTPEYSFAIDPPPVPTPDAAAPAAPQPAPEAPKFTQAELERLLAPIALYPDALLAQLLPASAYPLEIVQAHRWLEKNRAAAEKQDFSGADAQDWDPSVKAMLRFPTVLDKMNDDLEWTENLGAAIVNQPQDVANVIQLLRARAQKAGTLKSGKEMQVTTEKQDGRDVVTIASPDPSVIYVPSYDPVAAYAPAYNGTGMAAAAGLLSFGAGVAIGSAWRGNYWNWGTGAFYRPVWPGYPAWRPPYPGWRPGMAVGGGNNVNIGNDVNIGGKPWRPDPGHYRPGGRPGIGGGPGVGAGRPGYGGGRPGAGIGGGRPGAGGGPGNNGGLGGGGGIGGGRPGVSGGRPGVGKPGVGGGTKPIARPKPVTRPVPRPATRPAMNRPIARPAGGFGGAGVGRPAGGFRGGAMRAGGGFHGGRRSDLRLKHAVTLLGRLDNGLGFYRFIYNGGEKAFVGVMAQEVQKVMPQAVWRAPDGYLRVAYDKVGVKFQSYDRWVASGAEIPATRR
ncbi:DUF3300 domain-containing protein [Methylocystis sp. ATCC 49242]|uniref:DUF3300 domain-containing protein n=1 Tax=Methylocystis sp. ATCC 49242 TaxID=622637 RepID=UPI0001F88223|nr:DUF3300 domain-containing protein [Methylocystis sp. ATCC 49242]